MQRRWGHAAILLGASLVASSCASGPFAHIATSDQLPTDIPKDEQDRFIVKEAPPVAQAPKPEPNLSTPANPTEQASASSSKAVANSKKKRRNKKNAKGTSSTLAISVSAITPQDYPRTRPEKEPLWVGEIASYGVYWLFPAGNFTIDVLPHAEINGREVYHLKWTASSSRALSLIYKISDGFESFMDFEGLYSHRFHMQLEETPQSRDSLELNDSEKNQTFYWNRVQHPNGPLEEHKEFLPTPAFAQDWVSSLYYFRFIPIPDGKIFHIPLVYEGKPWIANVTVQGREMLQTPLGHRAVVKLKIEPFFEGQPKGEGYLWYTDDERRVLVRVELKVKIGTVVFALNSYDPGTEP